MSLKQSFFRYFIQVIGKCMKYVLRKTTSPGDISRFLDFSSSLLNVLPCYQTGDATRMVFASEMLLAKASRPTRYCLSLSYLSRIHNRAWSSSPFALSSLPSFRLLLLPFHPLPFHLSCSSRLSTDTFDFLAPLYFSTVYPVCFQNSYLMRSLRSKRSSFFQVIAPAWTWLN